MLFHPFFKTLLSKLLAFGKPADAGAGAGVGGVTGITGATSGAGATSGVGITTAGAGSGVLVGGAIGKLSSRPLLAAMLGSLTGGKPDKSVTLLELALKSGKIGATGSPAGIGGITISGIDDIAGCPTGVAGIAGAAAVVFIGLDSGKVTFIGTTVCGGIICGPATGAVV